jgi:hypothetical protein
MINVGERSYARRQHLFIFNTEVGKYFIKCTQAILVPVLWKELKCIIKNFEKRIREKKPKSVKSEIQKER